MKSYKMKSRFITAIAALACCVSCVEINNGIGGNLVPTEQIFKIYSSEAPLTDISLKMADSLSGYSSTRITVGAVKDEDYGTTTRSAALTLVPMFIDKLDLGKDPILKYFHFAVAKDTVNYADQNQANILQHLSVYELEKALDPEKDYDCNMEVGHGTSRINDGYLLYNGKDSLSFNFTKEFAEKYLTLKNDDVKDMKTYLKKFPGIFIESDKPSGGSGRINMFNLQLGYDANSYFISGNIAKLKFSSIFDGERKDTALNFYLSALDFYDIDSLLTNVGAGSYPQYGLNLTGHETRSKAGKAGEMIPIEGGGGLKPVISAKGLKHLAEEEIAKKGGNPKNVILNKATLVFPFQFPDNYKDVDMKWPPYLSPTVKITTDTSARFVGLYNASSEDENQGDINRSLCQYAPDITYHLQELLGIDENDKENSKTKMLDRGDYDIWLLIMATETITTSNTQDDDMSEYYNYLAYQSYYNNMYGGYGGYGGYGNSYSNYYNYMMMAQLASSSSSTTTTSSVQLDINRYYKAALNGPGCENGPRLKLVFSVPNSNKE